MRKTRVNTKDIPETQRRNFSTPFRIIAGMLIALVLTSARCKSTVENKSDANGFEKIFDGKTLRGWTGDTTYWRVENGNLVGEITPTTLLKTNSFIVWQGGQLSDF